MRRLIVTADDLGIREELDRGILEAARRGLVTSASLIVAGDTAERAATLAFEAGLSLGLHLCFVRYRPISEAWQIPSLVDRDGRLPSSVFRLLARRCAAADLDREADAQLEEYRRLTGREPDFVNTEQHAQLLPPILDAVIRLCTRAGISRTRLPAEHAPWRPNAAPRSWLWPAATALALAGRSRLKRARLGHPDCMLGGPESGRLDASSLDRLLHSDWQGTAELVVHPLGAELAALTQPDARRALDDAGVARIPFHAL